MWGEQPLPATRATDAFDGGLTSVSEEDAQPMSDVPQRQVYVSPQVTANVIPQDPPPNAKVNLQMRLDDDDGLGITQDETEPDQLLGVENLEQPTTITSAYPTSRRTAFRRASTNKVSWAANKSFEILKFKFKFPRARIFELFRARSRLYKFRRASPSARLWWNLSSR